jgi:hypothetical protein
MAAMNPAIRPPRRMAKNPVPKALSRISAAAGCGK